MKNYYHYTLQKNIPGIQRAGMFRGSSFTTEQYFDAYKAGQRLGVRGHYIDCVLMFKDDFGFQNQQDVQQTRRFEGGGKEFTHKGRPKPIAYRKVGDLRWAKL